MKIVLTENGWACAGCGKALKQRYSFTGASLGVSCVTADCANHGVICHAPTLELTPVAGTTKPRQRYHGWSMYECWCAAAGHDTWTWPALPGYLQQAWNELARKMNRDDLP